MLWEAPDPEAIIGLALQTDNPREALHRASTWATQAEAYCCTRKMGYSERSWRRFNFRMSGARMTLRALRRRYTR